MSFATATINLVSMMRSLMVSVGWFIVVRIPCLASSYSDIPSWSALALKSLYSLLFRCVSTSMYI